MAYMLFGYGLHHGFGYGGDTDDDGDSICGGRHYYEDGPPGGWRGFAEKSQAAQRREDDAKAAFDALQRKQNERKASGTICLLTPDHHLTGPCWVCRVRGS